MNCAYMAPLAEAVRTAGIAAIDRRADPSQITPDDFFAESDRVRRLFSQVINAPDPNRVAIVPSVSYGLAVAARNAQTERGGNIVVLDEQFPSNVYTWQRLCADRGLELRSVAAPPQTVRGRAEIWNSRLLASIDSKTAIVAVPHVHWTDGTRFDLLGVRERSEACRAILVVDGTQSIGSMPFDVQNIRPDVVVCAGYKWLLGPYSTGLAYFGPAFDHGIPIEENWIARLGSEVFSELVNYQSEYQPGALRYDVGERSNFTLLPMLAAGLKVILGWTIPEIQTYCRTLTAELTRTLRARGYWIEDDHFRGSHLFGVRPPHTVDVRRLAEHLQERQVAVSVRGNSIRVSPHLYNNPTDTDALLNALDQFPL